MASLGDIEIFLTRYSDAIARSSNQIERVALLKAQGELKARVFTDGVATNGSNIGNSYSTKPMYVKPKKGDVPAPSYIKPKGKNGKSTFKNGKKKVTKYFANGYKGLRSNQGRRTDKVDLQFNGNLFKSIILGTTSTGANALGFDATKNQSKIALANEERYNKKIFTLSNAEEKAVTQAIIDEVDKILNSL